MSNQYILLAIEEAKKSVEPLKCGVVVVKDGEVIAQTHNSQRSDFDASAHAEINALRAAGKRLESKNLIDCDIYCTCEPCVMCMAALAYAKVRSVTYAVPLGESYAKRWIEISAQQLLEASPHKFALHCDVMKDEAMRALYS